jgi:polysaccharide pyruvyl transferase WcaK-like protein
MKPLTVEVHGTGTHNRGAELMAIAIAQHLRRRSPGVRIAVAPTFGDFEARARHGFLATTDFKGDLRTRTLARLSIPALRRVAGLIDPEEVDVVLDASGFAFSDQWGPSQARGLVNKMKEKRRQGQKLVLLPQALGPFKDPEVAAFSMRLFARAELVYARDQHSYDAVHDLGSGNNLRLSPDITLLVHGLSAEGESERGPFTAIVPNIRMLDKTPDRSGEAYLSVLERAVSSSRRLGIEPVVVLHDSTQDRELIPPLFARTGELRVLTSTDPLRLKGILGSAHMVVASRFHALVSSLSQGVPCIATGWSHKYQGLFRDFGCEDFLLRDLGDLDQVDRSMTRLCSESDRTSIVADISRRAGELAAKVEEMWLDVDACIGVPQEPGATQDA